MHRGLGTSSAQVDPNSWKPIVGGTYPAPEDDVDWTEARARLDREGEAASAKPMDAQAHLDLADSALEFARTTSGEGGVISESGSLLTADPTTARLVSRSSYDEARRAALEVMTSRKR